MIAAITEFWPRAEAPDTTAAPRPRKPRALLLIGDILAMRGNEPDFLIRWRQDRETLDRD